MSNFSGLKARGSWFQFLHHNQLLDVIVKNCDYNIKKLIMMQKHKSRTVGLKPSRIGHVGRVSVNQHSAKKSYKIYMLIRSVVLMKAFV